MASVFKVATALPAEGHVYVGLFFLRLNFFINQCCFFLRCVFLPTAAAIVLAWWCYLCTPLIPLLSSQLHKVIFCGRHVMASVWDIKIIEALLILCIAYYVMKQIQHCCNLGVQLKLCYNKKKSANKCKKFCNFTGNMDHINKK